MDPIRLDEIPPPPGAKKGRFGYVKGHPAPMWIEDGFGWDKLFKRAAVIVGMLAGIATLVSKIIDLV